MLEKAGELNENIGRLLAKLDQLKSENDTLKADLAKKDEEIASFQKSGKIANIVNGIDAEGMDADVLKARIDENIQELDKCIALLSNK